MKWILFPIAFFLFLSCKKNNSTPTDYHLTADIDGVSTSFNTNLHITRDTGSSSNITVIDIVGYDSSGTDSLAISVAWSAQHFLQPGFYSDTTSTVDIGVKYEGQSSIAWLAGSEIALRVGFGDPYDDFTMSISAVDKQSIRGTFDGSLYEYGNTIANTKKKFSKGSFYMRF